MKAAVENGLTMWNGGEFYGTPEYNSMTIIKAYFTKYPEDADKVFLAMKGGVNLEEIRPDGSPENIRRSLDNILAQLDGKKKVDAFCCARRDPSYPLDITFGVIQREYIDTGKIGAIMLSECGVDTIKEAVKVAKIVAAEVELSLFTPDILKNGIAAALKEHDIPIIAYSPIGKGVSNHRFNFLFYSLTQTDALWRIQEPRGRQEAGNGCQLPTLPGRRVRAQPEARPASRGRGQR